MNGQPSASKRFPWLGLGLTLALVGVGLVILFLQRRPAAPPLPVYNEVRAFTLTNQAGKAVSLADLRGQVWVADIIFTRCAGPCLRMSKQMQELQKLVPPGSRARFVSLTTDPDFDTPPVLQAYGRRFEADPERWQFLTGTKQQIASLARESLKLTAIEKAPGERETPEDLFIHSTIFVLVDQQGRLRGVYETEGEGTDPVATRRQIAAAVNQLERERP